MEPTGKKYQMKINLGKFSVMQENRPLVLMIWLLDQVR